jgi:aryl sulfotransferase
MNSPGTSRPSKTVDYKGPITDTSRWQNFKPRPDDIFICTPPKCGTTWTQAIVAMLVFGKADHGDQLAAFDQKIAELLDPDQIAWLVKS